CQKIPLHASLNGYLTWVHCALRKANGMPPYPYNLRDFSYSEEEKSAGNFRLAMATLRVSTRNSTGPELSIQRRGYAFPSQCVSSAACCPAAGRKGWRPI